MLNKLMRWFTITVVIAMLLSMTTAMATAVTPTGMGPDEAMSPGEWGAIHPGEQHWFVFQYDGKNNPIRVEMFGKPNNGLGFKVMTEEQANVWRRTGEIHWTGAGAKNSVEKSDLFWTGEFKQAGKYYVLVEHSRQYKEVAWCMLRITGKGVTLLGGEPAAMPEKPAQLTPMQGSGPDLAYAPGQWQEMRDGVTNWFAFTYDQHANDKSIEIKFYSKHMEGVTFRILTPEQAEVWRKTGELKSIGFGAKNKVDASDLSWKGTFGTSGTYYVVVEHKPTGQESAWGKLIVSGGGVTF